MSTGRHLMMMTEAGGVRVGPAQRASLLIYASGLTDPADRVPGAVQLAARPLLAWAGQSARRSDLSARMSAMSQAHYCIAARHRSAGDNPPARLTPGQFLDEAVSYYRFLTEDAA